MQMLLLVRLVLAAQPSHEPTPESVCFFNSYRTDFLSCHVPPVRLPREATASAWQLDRSHRVCQRIELGVQSCLACQQRAVNSAATHPAVGLARASPPELFDDVLAVAGTRKGRQRASRPQQQRQAGQHQHRLVPGPA